jgi:hypothetical protein
MSDKLTDAMSTARLTEERLRTWIINQDDRERVCLGILALDARFSNIKPRRPKGGPDGGRDIEAVFDNREVVWGSVGFRANVNDSGKDKKWVEKKFKDDIRSAKDKNPELWGFVFFTNVDLTPAEVSMLEQSALSEGFSFIEIFYRERLRIALDSPRGLSLRYQHLNISLSEAEQAAFFAEYGSQIESLLHKGFGIIDERLKRIEFFHDCSKPLMGGSVILTLKQDCTPEDLGHFRFMAEILNMHEPDPHPGLWIAGRDAYSVWHSKGSSQKLIGVKSLVWSRNPDEEIQNTIFGTSAITANQLDAGGHLHKRCPYKTLGDLDQRHMSIYVTKPLFDLTASIFVIANDYIIAGADAEYFIPLDMGPLVDWPEPLSETEVQVPWIIVMLKIVNPPEWMNPELARTGWDLAFSKYTPEKRV